MAFCFLFACKTQANFPRNKFLAKDGRLSAALKLKDVQGGFAGFTGVIWTLHPDGSWDCKRIVGRATRKSELTGKLTTKQLQQIADVLAHAQVDKLPGRLGKFRGANPHVVTLGWGKQQCVWTLPPGMPIPKYPDQPFGKLTDEDSFAQIAQALHKLLKAPEKE